MNDEFLSKLSEEPRPEFSGALQRRLREIDEQGRELRARGPLRRLAPALAGGGLIAVVALAFTLGPVRAAAREFLDLFRVKRFAAVPVDPARLERLAKGGLDFKSLVAEQVQVVVPPEKPEEVATPESGALQAGITLAQPAALPDRYELSGALVVRPGRYRVQVDTSKLEALALAAGADEIEIPAWWNGATIDVELPPHLVLRYARPADPGATPSTEEGIVLVQSAMPKVALPEGFELATLGRLALRVAGMGPEEAQSFSRAIDWRTTLLVPVPVQGGTYREVDVAGAKGLLVTLRAAGDERRRRRYAAAGGAPALAAAVVLRATTRSRSPDPAAAWICSRWRSQSGSRGARARGRRAAKGLRDEDRGPRAHAVRGARRGLRLPRAERRGQDDVRQDAARPGAADRGEGPPARRAGRRPRARRRVGYLPEHFRFHEWLRGRELLRFHGRLLGLRGPSLERGIDAAARPASSWARRASAASPSTARA